MENLTDSRTGRLRYIYSIYLAGVQLVKLSEMLEKAYIPRRSEFGGFLCACDLRVIRIRTVFCIFLSSKNAITPTLVLGNDSDTCSYKRPS